MKIKIKEGFLLRKVAGEHVDIKQLGLVGRTKEQVLQAMAEKYEVDESVAADDLDRFLQQLRNAEILEETNE